MQNSSRIQQQTKNLISNCGDLWIPNMKKVKAIFEEVVPSWIVFLQNKKDSDHERTIRFDNYDEAVCYIKNSDKEHFFVNLIEEKILRKVIFHNQ